MSIGKKSIARAATAAAKAESVINETPEVEIHEGSPAVIEAPEKEPAKQPAEKFKKVSVGDKMPDFLL